MADKFLPSGAGSLPERWYEQSDGSFARAGAAKLSAEDKLALDKAGAVFRRSASVSATAGDGLLVSGVTTAGTISLTLAGGGTVTPTVGLGSTILPFSVTAATLGTVVGGTFQSLFFT